MHTPLSDALPRQRSYLQVVPWKPITDYFAAPSHTTIHTMLDEVTFDQLQHLFEELFYEYRLDPEYVVMSVRARQSLDVSVARLTGQSPCMALQIPPPASVSQIINAMTGRYVSVLVDDSACPHHVALLMKR